MSERPLFRLGKLWLTPVCAFGYPPWHIRLFDPRRAYGLLAEVGVPWGHYELRWQ